MGDLGERNLEGWVITHSRLGNAGPGLLARGMGSDERERVEDEILESECVRLVTGDDKENKTTQKAKIFITSESCKSIC